VVERRRDLFQDSAKCEPIERDCKVEVFLVSVSVGVALDSHLGIYIVQVYCCILQGS